MSLLKSRIAQSVIASLIFALITGFATWFVSTDRKVAALELGQATMHEDVREIKSDVRALRDAYYEDTQRRQR